MGTENEKKQNEKSPHLTQRSTVQTDSRVRETSMGASAACDWKVRDTTKWRLSTVTTGTPEVLQDWVEWALSRDRDGCNAGRCETRSS